MPTPSAATRFEADAEPCIPAWAWDADSLFAHGDPTRDHRAWAFTTLDDSPLPGRPNPAPDEPAPAPADDEGAAPAREHEHHGDRREDEPPPAGRPDA